MNAGAWCVVSLAIIASRGQRDPWIVSLGNGHLTIEAVGFKPIAADLVDGSERSLERVARALEQVSGQFVVIVPPEADRSYPPDTVLSRRRAEEALRRLLAAGANRRKLAGTLQPPTLKPVAAGQARIELMRIN